MARPSYFWLQLILFQFACTAFAAINNCYYPNQQEAEDDSPCNPDADSSACCGGGIGNICLSNGLCQGPNGAVIRGSCSDKNWDSENCANYCLGASRGGTDLISCANVTQDDTSYCCNGAENCCDSGDGRFSVGPHNPTTSATWNAASTKFIVVGTTSTTSSTRTTPSTSATSTKDPTTSSASDLATPNAASGDFTSGAPTNTDVASQPDNTSSVGTEASSPSDLSDGAKAGIGIGAVIGVILIVGLIYALWRLQKMNKMLAKEQAGNQYDQTPVYYPTSQIATASNSVNVAPPVPSKSEGQISELYGHYSPLHELPAEST